MKTTLVAAASLALYLTPPLLAQDTVEVMRAQVEELSTDLDDSLLDFNTLYENQLLALKTEAQKSGDLDLALAVAEELTGYQDGTTKPSENPKLKRLQEIYSKESVRIKAERGEKLATLLKGYKLRLEETQNDLTKSGDLENALLYRQESVAVDERLAQIAAANAALVPAAPAPSETPEEEPEENEGMEFAAGIYKTGSGHGPPITFSDSGTYNAGFFGNGRWKTRGEKMIMNGSDEFTYNAENETWVGTAFGGKTEVILKFVGEEDSRSGRDRDDEDSDDRRPRSPRGREDFRPRN